MLSRFCLLLVLVCVLGCTGSEKTFIPENPDPPPTQEEGKLKGPSETPTGKTEK